MKKKAIVLCFSVIVILGLVACSENKESSSKAETTVESTTVEETTQTAALTASDLANALLGKGMPIGTIIVYDESTDENGLLGRPNQYTSKVNFADTTCDQYDVENNPVGGSIEVFNNSSDAQTRYDYIQSVTSASSALQQYMYLYDNVLLRIDYDVLPASAEVYNSTLAEILGK